MKPPDAGQELISWEPICDSQ